MSLSRVPASSVIGDLLRENPGVQLTEPEIAAVAETIKPGCRFLIFGAGNDSPVWEQLNAGGRTVILESNPQWTDRILPRLRSAVIAKVAYQTRVADWKSQLASGAVPELDLPDSVRNELWDVILVDGPAGYASELPGRASSIVAASRLLAAEGTVFVHDSERPLEEAFCRAYLGSPSISVRGRALLTGYHLKPSTPSEG